MAAWVLVAVAAIGTALGLFRYVRINRRRIDRLEAQLEALSEAERIIARAHGRKDRSHLKLLGLIPLSWLGSKTRLAMASAASIAVVGAGFTATDTPLHERPATPPAAAEGTQDNPAVVDTPVRAYGYPPVPVAPPSTTTTVAATPPAATEVEGSAPTTDPPPSAPTTSTTTSTTSTTIPVELPRACLTPVPVDIPLCAAS